MELMERCQEWLKEGDFLLIIDALDHNSKIQMTPELAIVLAKAYHGLANGWSERGLYERSLKVLEKWKEWGDYQYEWNLLMGLTYYKLDQNTRAIPYFQKALKERPDDRIALVGLGHSLEWMLHPSFQQSFDQRVNDFWNEFSNIEAALYTIARTGIASDTDIKTIKTLHEITKHTVPNINIDLVPDNEKTQLILSPGGDWCKFHELVFLQRNIPIELSKRWECLVGYSPAPHWTVPVGEDPNFLISTDEVSVWLEKQEDGSYALSTYCERLVETVKEKKDDATKALEWLVNLVIGELPRMYYFYHVEPLETPKASPSIPLVDLAKTWIDKGYELSFEPSYYFKHPLTYSTPVMRGEPSQIPSEKQRWDITDGISNCKELLDDYNAGSEKHATELIADGAAPGFIFFVPPYDKDKERDKNYDLLDQLQDALLTEPASQSLTIVGASFGVGFWYLDFIAWNIKQVLEVAEKFFQKNYSRFSGFQLFMQNAKPLIWDGDRLQSDKEY